MTKAEESGNSALVYIRVSTGRQVDEGERVRLEWGNWVKMGKECLMYHGPGHACTVETDLTEVFRDVNKCTKLQEAAHAVLGHLGQEELVVRQQLEALQAEHLLIQEQISLQKTKAQGLEQRQREVAERVDLIRKTLAPLEAEMEKNDLILNGLADI